VTVSDISQNSQHAVESDTSGTDAEPSSHILHNDVAWEL